MRFSLTSGGTKNAGQVNTNFGGPDTVAKRGRGTLSKGLRYTGVGLAVTGALIAVFWSDVPSAFQDIGINVLPDGFVASRSFVW